MLFAAQILIGVPLAVLTLVGLVYLLAPNHLAYHRKVMEKLGEEVLARKLNQLMTSCMLGIMGALIAVVYSRPGEESLRGALDANSSTWLMCIVLIGMLASIRPPSHTALRALRRAGLMIIAFCTMEAMVLATGYPAGAGRAGALASALLLHVTWGTHALGQRTDAKTPWPLLAALCVPLIVGTALAFLA